MGGERKCTILFFANKGCVPGWFCLVHAGIVQHEKSFPVYLKGKILHIFQNKLCVYIVFSGSPPTIALSVYKTEQVEFIGFFRIDTDIFTGKLPAVGHIPLTAHMGLIPIIQVYLPFPAHLFKFRQFLHLEIVMLFKGLPFGAASYPFISSAKLFKKDLKVLSQTLFPLFASHSALAVRMRCRLAFMASRMSSLSSLMVRIGLRPRPALVYSPDMPSDLYRESQLLTLTWLMPVILPVSLEVRPSDFNKILWQRIRKLWLLPSFNPDSSSLRCVEVRVGVFTRPIMGYKDNNIN